jgi:hypothetical protein
LLHADDVTAFFQSVKFSRTSFLTLVIIIYLPIVLSYIIQKHFGFYFLIPLVIAKAFSYGFCFLGIAFTYADSGWLVRLLLLFSDTAGVLCLLLMWFSYVGESEDKRKRITLLCILCVLPVVLLDFFCISKYLGMLTFY